MCEQCTQLADQNHALQERAVGDRERIDALVNRITKADQENAGLKGQLTQLRTDSPRMKDAEEVFRFWQTRLHKSARTVFGPERQQKVLARLNEKSSHPDIDRKADLKWAVRGCEAMPYSSGYERHAQPGPGRKLKDDLKLVCFGETSIERFANYADDRADYVFSRFVDTLGGRFEAVDVLRDEAGVKPLMVCSTCPVCGVEWALTGFPGGPSFGELLVVKCHVNDCSSASVLSGLRALAEEKVAAA